MEKQWPEACFSFGINSQYFQIQIKQNFSIYRVYSYHPTKDIFFWKKKYFSLENHQCLHKVII